MSDRYSRNVAIDGFGTRGQRRLREARVLVVGAGGLGSPVLYYLAAAGVGTLGVVDSDRVDVSNLQRQILHRTADVGRAKVESAKERLDALNPEVRVIALEKRFTAENAAETVRGYDFVVDCADGYATKFLINDICVAAGLPYSHGAVVAMRGEAMTWVPGSADLRKVFGAPPAEGTTPTPTAAQAGVLGAVAGIVGGIQAAEAVKYLTGVGDLIVDRILVVDGRTMTFRELKVI